MLINKIKNPKVSVIIPAYNAEEFIHENLLKIKQQTLKDVEFIIVNDGSTDKTPKIIKKIARWDKRFVILNKENGGLSSARNAGTLKAKGDYIYFLDSDDFIENDALEVMYEVATENLTDIVIAGYDLVYEKSHQRPGVWIQQLFSASKNKVHLDDFPDVLLASFACGKLYKRDFYLKAGLKFIDSITYEDQPFTAEAYAKAKNGISIVPATKYHWIQRDGSISHSFDLKDLKARFDTMEYTFDALKKYASPNIFQSRLTHNLNNDLIHVMRKYNHVSKEYNKLLINKLSFFYEQLEDKSGLDACVDVAYQLITNGRIDEFEKYLEVTNISNRKLEIINSDGNPQINWDSLSYIGNFKSTNKILDENIMPIAELSSINLQDEQLKISIHAFITNICSSQFDYDVMLHLVKFDEKTGKDLDERISIRPDQRIDRPETIREYREWWADYSHNFYNFTVPFLFREFNETFKLEVEITAGNLHFSKCIDRLRVQDSMNNFFMTIDDKSQIRLKFHKEKFGFYYLKYVPIATLTKIRPSRLGLKIDIDSGSPLINASLNAGITHPIRLKAKLKKIDKLHYQILLHFILPKIFSYIVRKIKKRDISKYNGWYLNLKNNNSNSILTFLPSNEAVVGKKAVPVISNFSKIQCEFTVSPVVVVRDISIVGKNLEAKIFLANYKQDKISLEVRLENDSEVISKECMFYTQAESVASISITRTIGNLSLPVIPWKTLKLKFYSKKNKEQKVIFEQALVNKLPIEKRNNDGSLNLKIIYSHNSNNLNITLFNPIRDIDKGGLGWGRMFTRYITCKSEVNPRIVLMRTYYGETVTDNALALTEYILNIDNRKLDLFWATKSLETVIPEGAHRVIVESSEWFDLLSTAGTIIENVHQVDYLDKKPGQRIVETFHGYPFKEMGSSYNRSHEVPMNRIISFEKRENDWDFILSPAPYATKLYKDNFNFHGKFLEIGHPRNDILINENFDNLRSCKRDWLREKLKIKPEQQVILYAPTFRDYASISEFRSEQVKLIDYYKLSKKLGTNYTLLVRGHVMNLRAGSYMKETSNIINVSAYPEITDLILASDMAILDYSSLRFDYAQTGKPMIFFVPDYDEYFANRPPLIPYEPTAPGPICRTEKELIKAILNADDYSKDYGEALKEFKTKYTPLDDGHATERFYNALFGNEKEI